VKSPFDDEATRAIYSASAIPDETIDVASGAIDLGPRAESRRFPKVSPPPVPQEDATAFTDVSAMVRAEKLRAPKPLAAVGDFGDEATRAADDLRPRSLTDVEWDLE
jgi:hypothetical protein